MKLHIEKDTIRVILIWLSILFLFAGFIWLIWGTDIRITLTLKGIALLLFIIGLLSD